LISLLYITPISLGDIAFEQEIKQALLTPEEEEGGGGEEEEEEVGDNGPTEGIEEEDYATV
jgi:hypothetical protein